MRRECTTMTTKVPMKIIIDTDCGIDDALAILLALSNNSVAEVIAITCCFGNTSLDNVCSNVKRVLTVCNNTIPIYRGCERALLTDAGNTKPYDRVVHGSDGFGNCSDQYPTGDHQESEIPAPVALTQLVKKYPKEITLVAIGPLTNLAVAHRIDPSFTANLKAVVSMGGGVTGRGNFTDVAEFNIFCDPEAAAILFAECICPFTLVPLETTQANGIPWETFKTLLEVDTTKGELYRRITKENAARRLTFSDNYHDPDVMAVAAALYPESILSTIQATLVVECGGDYSRGMTILLKKSPEIKKKITIVTEFHTHILEQLRLQSIEN